MPDQPGLYILNRGEHQRRRINKTACLTIAMLNAMSPHGASPVQVIATALPGYQCAALSACLRTISAYLGAQERTRGRGRCAFAPRICKRMRFDHAQ